MTSGCSRVNSDRQSGLSQVREVSAFCSTKGATVSRLPWLLCALSVCSACSEDRTPVTPSGPVPPSVFVLSGTAYEHGPFGQRPMPNVALEISSDAQHLAPLSTSTDGRYSLSTSSSEIAVRARADGFRQPCGAASVLTRDTTLDVHLVPDTVLLTTGIPASMVVSEPHISGRVFERTVSGDRPIKSASVFGHFDVGMSWSTVDTVTDASGRYLLCGLKDRTLLYFGADGYRPGGGVTINLDSTTAYDLELFPR